MERSDTKPVRSAHPALFLLLYLPFGALAGYLATAVERAYSDAGVSTLAFGALISIALTPQVVKMAWAPLVDTTLTVKAWYLIGGALVAPSYLLVGLLPVGTRSMPALTLIAFAASAATTLMGMSCESLMAHATRPERRGAAAGWSQAGSVGGAALGGGAGLWLATTLHSLLAAGAVMTCVTLACSAALLLAPASTRHPRHATYLHTLAAVGRDCWEVVRSRQGLLVLLIFVLPLGSGGAANLFAAVSKSWQVTPRLLATITEASGLFVIAAALLGGFVCDRMDRKTAYLLFGLLEGLIAAGMAVAPKTPEWFVVFAIAYSASIGIAYAAFAAVTLESIGVGAAATKYNLFAGVSNIPVTIMPTVDGWAASRWSPSGMLWVEFATAAAAVALFVAVSAMTRARPALAQAG